MKNMPIFLAILTAFSMSVGQILFKIGSKTISGDSVGNLIISFISNPFLIMGIILYAITIIIWIYVLTLLPLSIAYPITALAYIIVPIISMIFLKEKISLQAFIGSIMIIFGIAIIHFQGDR